MHESSDPRWLDDRGQAQGVWEGTTLVIRSGRREVRVTPKHGGVEVTSRHRSANGGGTARTTIVPY